MPFTNAERNMASYSLFEPESFRLLIITSRRTYRSERKLRSSINIVVCVYEYCLRRIRLVTNEIQQHVIYPSSTNQTRQVAARLVLTTSRSQLGVTVISGGDRGVHGLGWGTRRFNLCAYPPWGRPITCGEVRRTLQYVTDDSPIHCSHH